jgi:transcriptional regulator with XRE-family HTH domain
MPTKAQIVREMRLDKRITQEEVAETLGVSQATYSAIERGDRSSKAVQEAMLAVNRMRTRTDRTDGGDEKVGRLKE